MFELINETGLPGQLLLGPDKDGYDVMTAVLKGTWRIEGERCVPHEEPVPIVAGDQHYEDPESSSVRLESDLAPFKPATDVVLLGQAYAPRVGAKESEVLFEVGSVSQRARVFGERYWSMSLGVAKTHGPKPFESIPLRWEHAFGGAQPKDDGEGFEGAEERNPLGTGFVKKRSGFVNGLRLPSFEHPKQRLKRPGQTPEPVGFGFVMRHWLPRRDYAGTYDAAWETDRMPLLPEDFDEQAFCGAPGVLQATPYLQGDENVTALGVRPDGPLQCALPGVRPNFEMHFEGWQPLEPALDTVVVDAEARQVHMTWRARHTVHKRILRMRAVRMRMPA